MTETERVISDMKSIHNEHKKQHIGYSQLISLLSLKPEEELVVKLKIFAGLSFKEIRPYILRKQQHRYGQHVSKTRVSHIYNVALRKMAHPSRLSFLLNHPYFDGAIEKIARSYGMHFIINEDRVRENFLNLFLKGENGQTRNNFNG